MKLWGGRFSGETNEIACDFHSSIGFDQRMFREDILGSIAHAKMLGKTGIISQADANQIIQGLTDLEADILAGKITFDTDAEDIHMNIEKLLTERIGEAGKRLHTARSRNDQVAVDLRLYLRREMKEIQELLLATIGACFALAKEHTHTLMPGYTHLQKAQPISFAHHLLAYINMFMRDYSRLEDTATRMNFSPLGSCALAGTGFPIDREMTSMELGFSGPCENSLDGVSDRDYAIEFLAAAAMIMMHLSRFCEEIILWSTYEFGFITLDDAYSTGSSIMPQKKNPDMAELIRGKTGRVYGDLMGLLTVMKGIPLAYNKDMQEDKEAVFDAIDTVKACLTVFTPMLQTMNVHPDVMERDLSSGFINATDVADYLAAKGLPFREAHSVSGTLVKIAEEKKCTLTELPLATLQEVCPLFAEDIYDAISLKACMEKRNSYGGPAPAAVNMALQHVENWLNVHH